jgi:hypothetical protein
VSGTIAKPAENPFEPPKSRVGVIESEFRSRVWPRVIKVCFFVLFGLAMLDVAAMSHPTNAPFAAWGLVCWLIALGHAFQIRARRGPAIRACREGVLVRLTQRSQIPEIPSAPGSVEMVWNLLNGRGARFPMASVPWEEIEAIGVTRLQWHRVLVIQVNSDRERDGSFFLVVPQSELTRSVRRIAVSLSTFFRDSDRRVGLSAWDDVDGG